MFNKAEERKIKDKELNIRIWEKIIDVQMHFNDIKSKNQTMFVSILTALLAATGYILMSKDISNNYFPIGSFKLYIYSIALLVALVFSICFYILDHSIYHVLLKGSVNCGLEFEKSNLNEKLTSTYIEEESKKSPLSLLLFDCKNIKGAGKKHKWFYGIIISVLLLLFIVSLFAPLMSDQNSLPKQNLSKKMSS